MHKRSFVAFYMLAVPELLHVDAGGKIDLRSNVKCMTALTLAACLFSLIHYGAF